MDHEHPEPPSFWRSPAGLAALVVAAVGGFYLVTEHTAHLFGVLPYLLVVACSLMHLFIWPTLLTMAMFPVLVLMYVRLAIAEERDSEAAFGDAWREYAALTPRFIPHRSRGGRGRAFHSH